MRIEEIIHLNKAIPPSWKSFGPRVRVTGYQTRSQIENISGVKVVTQMMIVLFYAGPLTYDYSTPQAGVELVNGKARISFGTTEFGKTTTSRWIIVLRPETNEPKPEIDQSIEGLLRFVLGSRFLLSKVFTKIIDLATGNQSVWSHSLLNPLLMGPEKLTPKSVIALDNAATKIESLSTVDRDQILRALRWINDAFDDTDKWDSFLKIWIAIEMVFIRKQQAPSVLRDAICNAYELTANDVNHLFAVGQIYGLRKQIIHHGALPNFDARFVDILSDLFRDLLAWKLTDECPKIALFFLKSNGLTFHTLIKGPESEHDST